ncbi:MAG TPA: AsmA family protein, partial [Xanthomonadales bacterium]|nr:AsmA family protein [Xanthomonadales bacterium]
MKRLWRVAAILLLLVLAVALLVFFSASSWLETAAGRNLLQRELGKNLGLQAELQGEYALELFPGLQIVGQQLELREVISRQAMARLESYELHLALWPLLSRQVDIHKVVIRDGFLDLDLLMGNGASSPDESKTESQLPSIHTLQVSGLKLLQSSTDLLNVDQLVLENFAPGKDAAISLGFSLPGDHAGSSLVRLSGDMQLATAPLQLSLKRAELSLRVNDQAWPVGRGQLNWDADRGAMEGSLTGNLAGFSSQFEFLLQTVPAIKILLSARLVAADGRSLSGKISVRDEADLWLLEPVELILD